VAAARVEAADWARAKEEEEKEEAVMPT